MTLFTRPGLAVVIAAAAMLPLTGCAGLLGQAAQRAAAAEAPVAMSAEEAALLAETNAVRTAHGLAALRPDAQLVALARARSRDMAKRGYFDHVTPEGRSVFTIMRERKMLFGLGGENIAKNGRPAAYAPREVVAGWVKSPAHRTNLLNEGYGRVGIGAVRTSEGQVFVTQILVD